MVHMGLFSSIVTLQKNKPPEVDQIANEDLIIANKSIYRMDIASLRRFAIIRKAKSDQGLHNTLMFFMPCEELNGGSLFSKLAFDLNIIQPYLEKIDVEFIQLMN